MADGGISCTYIFNQFLFMIIERIEVAKKDKEFFVAACDSHYINPKVIEYGEHEITYEVIITMPSELYYIGRMVQMKASEQIIKDILKTMQP